MKLNVHDYKYLFVKTYYNLTKTYVGHKAIGQKSFIFCMNSDFLNSFLRKNHDIIMHNEHR